MFSCQKSAHHSEFRITFGMIRLSEQKFQQQQSINFIMLLYSKQIELFIFESNHMFEFLGKSNKADPQVPKKFDNPTNSEKNVINNLLAIQNEAFMISQYDQDRLKKMYEYPAQKYAAQNHKRANTFGYTSRPKGKHAKILLCPCCEIPIQTIDIPLNYPTTPSKDMFKAGEKVYMLDSGTSLFFTFIKMAIAYLTLRFVITDAFNAITSIGGGHFCDLKGDLCSGIFSKFSSLNRRLGGDDNINLILDILNLVTIVVSIVFFVLYRRYQYSIYDIIDRFKQTQDDYTLLIENIPTIAFSDDMTLDEVTFDHETLLRDKFEGILDDWTEEVKKVDPNSEYRALEYIFYRDIIAKNKLKEENEAVQTVTCCFDMNELNNMMVLREDLMATHISRNKDQNYRKSYNDDKKSLNFIPNQIELLNRQYSRVCKQYSSDNSAAFHLSHFAGKAFISFQYQHYRDYILREYENDSDFLKIGDNVLVISLASKPEDIFWFNLNVTDSQRLKSIISSYLVLLMVLIFAFLGLVGIQLVQNNAQASSAGSTSSSITSTIITLSIPILINAINYGLSALIISLTESQKHKTRTDYMISLILKNVVSQFLNTAAIFYILSLIQNEEGNNGYLLQNGLVIKVSSLIAVSGFISIVTNFFQIGSSIQVAMTKFMYRNADSDINKFQVQLNNELQQPEFNFAERYSYYIVQVYTISFYSYVTPIVVPALIVIFIIQYWVDKFNLFDRCSSPYDMNFQIARYSSKFFQFSLLIFAVGSFIFGPYVEKHKYSYFIGGAGLIISALYILFLIFAPSALQKRIFSPAEEPESISYSQCKKEKKFTRSYWNSNPGTMYVKEKKLHGRGNEYETQEEDNEMFAEENVRETQLAYGEPEVETYGQKEATLLQGILHQGEEEQIKYES